MPGFWLALLLAAGGTGVLRTIFLASRRPPRTPSWLAPAMEYVPVSILSALVFQGFLMGDGPLFPRLAAAAAALAAALAFSRDFLTIACGLLAYWILDALNVAPF
jgi:branched-subunit amino acid transport protein